MTPDTLLGALIGYRLAISAHVREKRHDFIVEQLRDFYSPMLTLRAEISSATSRCWDLRNDYFDPDQFFETTWPLYQKMATLFSERLWLASPSTRRFHSDVLNVIDGFQERVDNGFIQPDDLRHVLTEFDRLAPFTNTSSKCLTACNGDFSPARSDAWRGFEPP